MTNREMTMNMIHIVMRANDLGDIGPVGVFSDEELANKAIAEAPKLTKTGEYRYVSTKPLNVLFDIT